MQQLDSVAHEMFMALHAAEMEAEEHHEPRSPYQVLRMLPRTRPFTASAHKKKRPATRSRL
jgi:hypothetical protein